MKRWSIGQSKGRDCRKEGKAREALFDLDWRGIRRRDEGERKKREKAADAGKKKKARRGGESIRGARVALVPD